MDNFFIFYFLFAPDIRIECVYYNRQIDLENNTKKYIYLYSAFHNILPKLYIYLYSAIHTNIFFQTRFTDYIALQPTNAWCNNILCM